MTARDNRAVGSQFSDEERRLAARLAAGSGPITSSMAALARKHRVHLLLADSLTRAESVRPDLFELTRELRTAAALDAARELHLKALLAALLASGIDALLLKGAALAHMVYSAPHLRPRVDIDLMIRRDALDRAEGVLAGQGWMRPRERDAELSAAQRHYVRPGPAGSVEHLDVHWKIANPQTFANALAFEELRARAVPIAALGDGARALCKADALFLACVHRVAHHDDCLDILWLWDIHLLSDLSDAERSHFLMLTDRNAMWSVCQRSLVLAATLFATPGADALSARLRERGAGRAEPSARFLGGTTLMTELRADLGTLRRWQDRVMLVAEHAFPSTAYIRSIYPQCPVVLLPLAYAHRIAWGAPKWFRQR
jgi:hypothetical protein